MDGNSKPIIQSLLDLDFYKLTMAQFAWANYWWVPVKYFFKCRTPNVPLADIISEDELRDELNHISSLRFTHEELSYLRESQYIPKGLFSENFLNFLEGLHLPPVEVSRDGNSYRIEVKGYWHDTILWETFILILNELYYRGLIKRDKLNLSKLQEEGDRRLNRKTQILKANPKIRFIEFGTRRRFSCSWQDYIVGRLQAETPEQLVGTSNVLLAKKFGLRPVGTFAHELYMVLSGVHHESDDTIRASHNKVLQLWWELYGEPLSIALTDTYGTDFFFRDFTAEQAKKWRGLRQDSGDPFAFGERAIVFYENLGIDPKTKTVVFSDGLDVETIVTLHKKFSGRIKVSFGWGTNLTNDLGLQPLSLVVKVAESCGKGTVKFSDNLAKAMGSPEDIERFKRIFGYTENLNKPCVY